MRYAHAMNEINGFGLSQDWPACKTSFAFSMGIGRSIRLDALEVT